MNPYYQKGDISIFCGDAREIASVGLGLDACIADPTYGMKDRVKRKSAGRGNRPTPHSDGAEARDWPAMKGDDRPFDPQPWISFKKCALFGAIHYSTKLPVSRAWVVWDKREGTTSDDNADCDFIWTNFGGPARLYSQLWRGVCKRGEENHTNGPLLHPWQKPVALMSWLIRKCSATSVFDPYMGSGTTLVAAKRLGIPAVGIDIEEWCCEIAANRVEREIPNGVLDFAASQKGEEGK